MQSNGSDDLTPRKRPRKQQFGEYPQGGKKFQIDLDAHIQSEQQTVIGTVLSEQGVTISYQSAAPAQANTSAASTSTSSAGAAAPPNAANLTNRNAVKTNNENSPPKIVDFYIKRPKTCNLLDVSKKAYHGKKKNMKKKSTA